VKLLGRFTRRVIVNYDPDTAGQAATERSLTILLEQNCDARVLALPGGKDPDSFIRSEGAAAYARLLEAAPPYLDYLIGRAQRLGMATAEEKLRAVNFLLPYVQRIPNALLRSEWATRISQGLRVEQPVLREALRRAATERHGQVKTHAVLSARAGQPAERRMIQMLMEADELRAWLAEEISQRELHRGLETEKIFAVLLEGCAQGRPDVAAISQKLDDRDRRLLLEIAFENQPSATRAEAESCLDVLRAEDELGALERQIEAHLKTGTASDEAYQELWKRKRELRRRQA
jgi:DNA primase